MVINACKGCIIGSIVCTKVQNAMSKDTSRREVRVAAVAETNDFTAYRIFLVMKGQGAENCGSSRRCPIHIWTSENQNGEVSEGLLVYSPGRRREKKARPIISAVP